MTQDPVAHLEGLIESALAEEVLCAAREREAVQNLTLARARVAHLRQSVEYLKKALSEEPTSPLSFAPGELEQADRRIVRFTDPQQLKGLRRLAWEVLVDAGAGGLTNEEFCEAVRDRLDYAALMRLRTRAGGERRALMDGHMVVRRNAERFGYAMRRVDEYTWALVPMEAKIS